MRSALFVAIGLAIGIGAGYGSGALAQGSPKLDIVVVCANCIPDDMPQEAYNRGNILLDQNTGNIWFYQTLNPGVKPRLMGTLTTPGQPLAKPPQKTATR